MKTLLFLLFLTLIISPALATWMTRSFDSLIVLPPVVHSPPHKAPAAKVDNKAASITRGKASWYNYSLPGQPDYSKEHFTAASHDYPRGTMLIVCPSDAGIAKVCTRVRVNDYFPPHSDPTRVIDLSSLAFSVLAPLSKGVIEVEIEVDNNIQEN